MSKKSTAQWYIATTTNGNEDSVIKTLKAKVRALHFEDQILDCKVIKFRSVEETIFDSNNPTHNIPATMRNSTYVKWVTVDNGVFKKYKITDTNKYPGYIYIKMEMNEAAWFAVRNTVNITGIVGSSGKGAKPIPISSLEELELLNGESSNPDCRIVITPNAVIEMDRLLFNERGELVLDSEENKTVINKKTTNTESIYGDLDSEKEEFNNKIEFKVGHTVDINSGDYSGLSGQISRIIDQDEFIVDVQILGKLVNVKLNRKQLKLSN
ncbi:transcription termination/antitermination protein NusG [Mycoplasma bradburyae]|uniref:Transcription termination/antitermination protein NusG n=1 Tax=Mycoplasma bradburyae TaxID=2963128 RepID=A0AAW6HQT5_9MOLU|nr:transcription termination/antitermination protein NusG [Mycoplasma bradburyae]MDC4163593.1 transcription termination/antitermination protein NusG [Mycoplasma bradburyae]MDC4182190.1 transcription termination/antitermination protein NusG [Mycoplasma bradburyae]MDC4182960.1 transcription termination/antitermination protein NusG [Mycoplasma bradburyae]MDC4183696.1 transcription termination/antitermination protein NusG [Mycoplasma bradburyae]MDC4184377.1 transcription termination/antiterminatio